MHPQCSSLLVLLGLLCFSGASSSPLDVAPRFVAINPTSMIIINGTYYYIESSAQKNWFNALAACEAIGYQLISFGTVEKFEQVNDFPMATSQPTIFWTSGNDFYTLGEHHWYPRGEGIPSNLWGAQQPDNANGVEHCDEIYRKGSNYTLKDDNCNLARNYICELTP